MCYLAVITSIWKQIILYSKFHHQTLWAEISWQHQMHIFVDIFTCPAGSSCVCWPSSCCPWCSRCWSGPACPSRPRSAWSPARPCSRRCCPGPKWRGLQELDIGRGWQTKTRCCRGLIWHGLLGLDFGVSGCLAMQGMGFKVCEDWSSLIREVFK